MQTNLIRAAAVAVVAAAAAVWPASGQAWEPTKTVELIVPAGIGGGAGQMAQLIQGIVTKYKLMPTSMVVISKKGGSGAEGFLYVKNARGDPHKLIITLSNLFTTPLATGSPFSWTDYTPIAMMALDEFVLWVNAKTPYQNPAQYIDAVKKDPMKLKMGGTGSKQEDQIITAAIEQQTGAKFTYVPYHGGGEVCTQLVGGHIDSTVNNPIECVAHWRAGTVRPLCVFDSKRMPYPAKITKTMSWEDIPTCKSSGLDIEYLMLRGIMTAPDVPQDAVAYYVKLLEKVRSEPEWSAYMNKGAFNQSFMTGDDFHRWLVDAAKLHHGLMQKAGFLHK
ncbi:MAG TPA: tripartite tricarboxylate transporter substrate-binding protein [Burkholderiales bacterium]|nr:tripartite tricarboxylate transporter substrate-binding protein [Burkholderiales bacterium]